jgi:hypothetical protein
MEVLKMENYIKKELKQMVNGLTSTMKELNKDEEFWNLIMEIRNNVYKAVKSLEFPEHIERRIILLVLKRINLSGNTIEMQKLVANEFINSGLILEVTKTAKILHDKLLDEKFSSVFKLNEAELLIELEILMDLFKSK